MDFLIYVLIFVDQTPTPTRFLKNCEEVGLFNELASSFEHEFCKTHEDEQRTKHLVRNWWMYASNKLHTVGFLMLSKLFHYFIILNSLKDCIHLLLFSKAVPLQTPSEIKVENEGPLQVDSSSPGSPESSSSMSDDSRDSMVRSNCNTLQQTVPFCG